jgi:2-polyprenyl-3-methyl-5-hydroxy-6-metoxy-1,4-benzoquinol methylase
MNQKYQTTIERDRCPVCESSSTTPFLFREQVPVHQNLVMNTQEVARNIVRGDLDLVLCEACGFIFNRAFDMQKIMYGEEYDNTQSCSPAFSQYMDNLARYMIGTKNVRNSNVVEVGCGKGLFLRKLVEFEGSGNRGYGFDPSYVGEDIDLDGRLRFEKRYYDSNCADIPADVIVCRHVIEHVPTPQDLLRNIKKALVKSPDAHIFFETPCVEWILRNHVIWDFFYEHCSYFTSRSLSTVFEMAGFEVESVRHEFEGQYLWLEAKVPKTAPPVTKDAGTIPALAAEFAHSENVLKRDWERRIQHLAKSGNVALWGAGAKGVTFANLVDPQRKWIKCVVDLNPQKQGGFVPGTGHPIVGYKELAAYDVRSAVLMNPNYREENLVLLREADLNVELVWSL